MCIVVFFTFIKQLSNIENVMAMENEPFSIVKQVLLHTIKNGIAGSVFNDFPGCV